MLVKIIEVTFPIFAIAFIGYIYARKTSPDFNSTNKFVMDIALPVLIFISLSGKSFDPASALTFTGASVVLILLSGLLALPFIRMCGMARGVFLPLVMFANVGPVGIPMIALAYGEEGLVYSVILLVISNLLHFTLGATLISGRIDWKLIYGNPLIWACLAGILVGSFGLELMKPLNTTLTMIGNVLVPMMLISLGARLASSQIAEAAIGIRASTLAVIIRLIALYPLLGMIQLTEIEQGTLILFACLPPAVFNFMLADRFQIQPERVASTVLSGHMLGLIFLPMGIWLAFI